MRILVTGAAGFIGSHVVRSLCRAGHQVVGVVRPQGELWRLEGDIERIDLLRIDIAQVRKLRRELAASPPDACIHTAWYARPGRYWDAPENLDCVSDSISLLRLLSEIGCRQVVAVGTCAEYQAKNEPLTEADPAVPDTLYGAAKLSLGLAGQQLAPYLGLRFAWARLFYTFGPYEDEARLVPSLIRSLLGGKRFTTHPGDQIRDYLFVEDVADALIHLAVTGASGAFNVCSGEPIRTADLLQRAALLVGAPELLHVDRAPLERAERAYVCGDPSRLLEHGWRPRRDIASALTTTVDWWRRVAAAVDPMTPVVAAT